MTQQKEQYERVLVNAVDEDKVTVEFEFVENTWVATSYQLPGLLLTNKDFLKVCDQLAPVIRRIWINMNLSAGEKE